MTPLTTKAAETLAGLAAELRGAPSRATGPAEYFDLVRRAADLIEQQAAELAEARAENERLTKESADRLKCMDRRADRLIELTDKLAEAKVAYDGMLSTWAESRERHLAAEARATTAESERDEALAELDRLRKLCTHDDDDICQTLGKALGYPWYKDDQSNFPGATEENGVCVGEHVAASIAAEAAKRLDTLKAERDELLREKERLGRRLDRLTGHTEMVMVNGAGFAAPKPVAQRLAELQVKLDQARDLGMAYSTDAKSAEGALIAIRRRTIFGPGLSTSDLLDLTAGVAGVSCADRHCPHAPTYDAGLCCGHPDDCTFISPPASQEDTP